MGEAGRGQVRVLPLGTCAPQLERTSAKCTEPRFQHRSTITAMRTGPITAHKCRQRERARKQVILVMWDASHPRRR